MWRWRRRRFNVGRVLVLNPPARALKATSDAFEPYG